MRSEDEIKNEIEKLNIKRGSYPRTSDFLQEVGDINIEIATLKWVVEDEDE